MNELLITIAKLLDQYAVVGVVLTVIMVLVFIIFFAAIFVVIIKGVIDSDKDFKDRWGKK